MKKNHIKLFSPQVGKCFFILLSGLVSGCVSDIPATKINSQQHLDLKNIELNITDFSDKSVKLVNGLFEGDHLHIHVLRDATADLNQDGLIDGVVVIFENTGGSGEFSEISLLLNNGHKLIHTDQVFIGDRIRITHLDIKKNIITIDYMDRGYNDAYTVNPYIKKRIRYQVQGMKLEQL